MKKYLLSLSALLTALVLAACSPQVMDNDSDDDKQYQATLVVQFADKKDEQTISFEKGDSVMDVLEDYHEIEDESGMVTEIDGVSQDASKNTYWMYKVNGEMAEKGAEELTVNEGDTIEFYLETFQ